MLSALCKYSFRFFTSLLLALSPYVLLLALSAAPPAETKSDIVDWTRLLGMENSPQSTEQETVVINVASVRRESHHDLTCPGQISTFAYHPVHPKGVFRVAHPSRTLERPSSIPIDTRVQPLLL